MIHVDDIMFIYNFLSCIRKHHQSGLLLAGLLLLRDVFLIIFNRPHPVCFLVATIIIIVVAVARIMWARRITLSYFCKWTYKKGRQQRTTKGHGLERNDNLFIVIVVTFHFGLNLVISFGPQQQRLN